jgi:peptidoglycan/xylan/chitin deacetylase (PgdA/CDA1 family)
MSNRIVYLMYHEIERAGRALVASEPGYVRYCITEADFRAQLAHLTTQGYRGASVTEALTSTDQSERLIALTFDDGSETDCLIAAPLLKEAAFNATFYVIAGRVNQSGYLNEQQLRQLSDAGFEIGCHSMTHAYLDGLNNASLRVEIAEAKTRLEQVTGKRVAHFSCPGGRWNRHVARVAREAGYESVATSRIGVNSNATDPMKLARVAVMRDVTIAEFDRLCRAEGFTARRARAGILNAAKTILGNAIYERVRASALDRR